MRRSHGGHGRTRVRGTFGALLGVLVLLLLAAPATAAPPVCSDLTLAVHSGESVSGQLQCNDADADPLNSAVATQPAHGSAGVDGAGSVTYFAPSDYAGADPFTVLVDDGAGGTDTVQVGVTVTNTAPVCQPVDLGTSSHGAGAFLFGAVDCFDADGDFPRDWEIVDQAAHGVAAVQFGSLTYDPDDAYVGKDTFTYRVSDGVTTSQKATVTVELSNSAPECTQTGTLTIRQDKPASAQVQ